MKITPITPAEKILNGFELKIKSFLGEIDLKKISFTDEEILEDLKTKDAFKFTVDEVNSLINYFDTAPEENLSEYLRFVFEEFISGDMQKDSKKTIWKFIMHNRNFIIENRKKWN